MRKSFLLFSNRWLLLALMVNFAISADNAVWQTKDYIALRAPSRLRCGGVKLIIKEDSTFDAHDVQVIGFKYNPASIVKLQKLGSCPLVDFPAAGIAFDRPAYGDDIHYRLYFALKNPQTKKLRFLLVDDVLEDVIEVPAQLCLTMPLSYKPLNLRTRVTTGEMAALAVAVGAAGGLVKIVSHRNEIAAKKAAKKIRQKNELESMDQKEKNRQEEMAKAELEGQEKREQEEAARKVEAEEAHQQELYEQKMQRQDILAQEKQTERDREHRERHRAIWDQERAKEKQIEKEKNLLHSMASPPALPVFSEEVYKPVQHLCDYSAFAFQMNPMRKYLAFHRLKRNILGEQVRTGELDLHEQKAAELYDATASSYYTTIKNYYKEMMHNARTLPNHRAYTSESYKDEIAERQNKLKRHENGLANYRFDPSNEWQAEFYNQVDIDTQKAVLEGLKEGWEGAA